MCSSKSRLLLAITSILVCLAFTNNVHTSSLSSLMISDDPINNNHLRESSNYLNSFRLRDHSEAFFGELQSDEPTRSVDKKNVNNRNNNKKGSLKKSKNTNNNNRSQRKGRGGNRKGRRQGDGNENRKTSRGQRQKANKNALRLLARGADNIEGGGAFPPLSNIAPRALVSVNATCGLNGHEEYCKLVDSLPHKTWETQCGICDDLSADVNKRHPIEAILNNSNSWWQSPTLQYGQQNEYVTITLDLRQPHQIFFIMLKSSISPRPASWILERSLDNVTYEPWQYFGLSDLDCRRRYGIPGQNGKYIFQSDSEVICTTQFSKPMPLESGEIHVSLLKNRPGSVEQTQELMDFITARYIRIRLQGMHSTANADNSVGWLLDAESLRKRSFYSLKLIRVSGRLDCHGHAIKTMEIEDVNGEMMQQCVCVHNTCGIYCDQCCPLYNEEPFREGLLTVEHVCKRCECNEHAKSCVYDDSPSIMGGVCLNCTHFTTGRHCEKCISGYFRNPDAPFDSEEPCIECDCAMEGSTGNCDPDSGACVCRKGFTGSQCTECLPGYKGENCEACTCDSAGSVPDGECNDPCQCKLFVEDEQCSSCVPGYFALRAENPDGCLKCYCSGVAVTCRSYEMESTTFETLEGWRITDISKSMTTYPSRDNDTGNLVFGLYEMSEVEAVYWLAPKSYAGNRLESYGSNFVVQTSWVIIRGDTSGKPTSGPNIILIGKNGAKIAYADEEFQGSGAIIEIPLTENGWYHVPKTVKDIVTRLRRTEYRGDPVTRVQFMSVLSDIETVMIRGTFHTDQAESILERATLYAGSSETEENEWSLVEECQCPPGYSGLSCETCNFGYIRTYENSTTHEVVGKCIPCACNGHAESCELESGDCGECIHNTFGERCERCKMGYYGNAMHGTPLDCKRCACPLLDESNNFSPSCQLKRLSLDTNQYEFDSDEDYVCTQCPDGYIGDHCEQCDDGYYGNPMVVGSKCLPCPCNGGPCHPITGECITCLGNTEGWRCERCQLGFWGDATAACEPCNCNLNGSTSNICNPETGKCPCRERFTGKKCNECESGYAKTAGKFECLPCECHVNGSADIVCDPVGGQCMCKSGVMGLKCDECQDEYYGLTATGCEGKYSYICRHLKCISSSICMHIFLSYLLMDEFKKKNFKSLCI